MQIWENKPPGTLWATPGLLRDTFTFYTIYFINGGAVSFIAPIWLTITFCGGTQMQFA
jgi:hypothetical protein